MNILKIKTIFSLAFIVVLLSTSTSNAQNDNFKNTTDGGKLQSDENGTSTLYFRNSTGLNFGSVNTAWATLQLKNRLGPVLFNNSSANGYNVLTAGNAKIIQQNDGRVAIASTASIAWDLFKNSSNQTIDEYSLFVEKGILSEKCKIAVKELSDWSDYVFEEDYEMMDIDELEDYVTENKHLPNVPSAEEMVENGLDVAKMDAKLLEKIEEAYLYIIDLNKKVDALANENKSLKSTLEGLSITE